MVGIEVAVSRDGQIVYDGAAGYADSSAKRAIADGTRFRIASITKEFTAGATLVELARNHLAAKDRILPVSDCPQGLGNVSYTELIEHNVGYEGVADWSGTSPIEISSRVHALCGKLQPNDGDWDYRNDNYIVLTDEVAALAHSSFDRAVARDVLAPLGIATAGFVRQGGDALGYQCDGTARPVKDPVANAEGAGGMFSSARDLAHWDVALLTGRYPAANYRIFEGGAPVSNGVRYGAGIQLVDDSELGPLALHDGEAPGYTAINVIYYPKMISVSILTNCDKLDGLKSLSDEIYDLAS